MGTKQEKIEEADILGLLFDYGMSTKASEQNFGHMLQNFARDNAQTKGSRYMQAAP